MELKQEQSHMPKISSQKAPLKIVGYKTNDFSKVDINKQA